MSLCIFEAPSTVNGDAPVNSSYVSTPKDHQSTACHKDHAKNKMRGHYTTNKHHVASNVIKFQPELETGHVSVVWNGPNPIFRTMWERKNGQVAADEAL